MCVQQIIKLMKTPMQVVKVYFHSNISVVSLLELEVSNRAPTPCALSNTPKKHSSLHMYTWNGCDQVSLAVFTKRNFVTLVRDNSEKHKMQETEPLWSFQVHIN